MRRAVLIAFVLLLQYTASAQSQRPKPSPTATPPAAEDVVRIDLNVVLVDAVVTDKHVR